MNRSTKKQNKTNLPARRITKKNENKLKDRHVPSLPGWNRKSLLFSLIFLLAPSLFFQSFLFSFFNLPSNGSKKIYYSWMCFQLLLFPRFVWLGSERERERKKKERRVYVGDLWILLCAATAIYLHSGSGGSKAVRGFVLSSFFYRRTRYPPTMVHATQPSSPFWKNERRGFSSSAKKIVDKKYRCTVYFFPRLCKCGKIFVCKSYLLTICTTFRCLNPRFPSSTDIFLCTQDPTKTNLGLFFLFLSLSC